MDTMAVCRDRFGMLPVGVFQVWTCTMCYTYLFPPSSASTPTMPGEGISSPWGKTIYPDLKNSSSMSLVCSWLDKDDCSRWVRCCHAAVECCHAQVTNLLLRHASQKSKTLDSRAEDGDVSGLNTTFLNASDAGTGVVLGKRGLENGDGGTERKGEGGAGEVGGGGREGGGRRGGGGGGGRGRGTCPQTWDGLSCVDATSAGLEASLQCPPYLHRSLTSARGYRKCSENGSWWTHPVNGQEWTDYTDCGSLQDFHTLYIVGTVCNTISLLLLLPACVIFLSYRVLRKQQRIRVHVNLFLSFLLTNGSLLLWEILVYRNRLYTPASESHMHQNTVACRVLYCVTRYAWVTAFVWMFVEGFHLYRLISCAFTSPLTITHYYLLGWGASLLPITAYIAVRVWLQHGSCWVQHAGHYEWILYGPQLLCIVANVFFFVSILRILMSELQSHPNEPSNFRRALKATILLVPLFGLQLFLVAYSPGPPLSHLVYEVTAKAVSCLQGAFVAIIFCFCNGEVQGQIRDTFSSRCRMFPNNLDLRSVTMSNNVTTMDSTRGSYSMRKSSGRNTSASNSLEGMDINNTHYIALNAWVQARSPDTNTD